MNILLQWIDHVTMYRLVLYVLISYVSVALVLSFTSILYYAPIAMLASLAVLLSVGVAVHYLCARLWRAPANLESTIITLLILFFLFDPTLDTQGLISLAAIAVFAVASKYLLAYRKLHICNPVAITAVAFALAGVAYSVWWIGSAAMFGAVLLGGILITQKIRRWTLVLSCLASALVVYVLTSIFMGNFSIENIASFFLAWPIIFFATVMVTEPLSTPAGKLNHILYGALAGGLSSVPFHFGPLYSSPELALLVANIAFYPTTLRARLVLTLVRIQEIAQNTYEYVFQPSPSFSFKAGQFLEWTLPHAHQDKRGIRRYFTVASSPTRPEVSLAFKMVEKSSSYKKQLTNMEIGDHLYATALDGDFVLPAHVHEHSLVFIAGGIGITPFRSMIQYLLDTEQKANIVLFYCNNTARDIAWKELWDTAEEKLGLHTVYVLAKPEQDWQGESGFITPDMLQAYVTDIQGARFYISGPPGMVRSYEKLLQNQGVRSHNIKKDFFPGLA